MKNAKRRALGLILSAVLIVSALVVGFSFSAAADEAPAAHPEEVVAPEIVSKNISYSSYLYIYFAIPEDTVAGGAVPELRVYKSFDAISGEPAYTVTEYELQRISAISGIPENYYVFKTNGVAAKNMGDSIFAQPVAVFSDGTEISGNTVEYSIAEYLYERLYKLDFINKVEEDGMDYFRRNLYLALLEYGSAAQQLLIEDKLGITVKHVDEFDYFATVDGDMSGFYNSGDAVTVPSDYEGTIAKGYEFSGWKVTKYIDGVIESQRNIGAGASIALDSGVIILSPILTVYDEYLAQEGRDEVIIARKWAELEDAAGKELTDAFKLLYTLYDDSMADWSASLYAKGYIDYDTESWLGGYYASTAGRDSVGFGPDVQCTEQMLRFVQQSGMLDEYGGNVAKNLPDWFKYQVVYFVKSLQSESNGYFYHPQWGQERTDAALSRRGRDLGWATSLLERFGSAPTYDAPNGDKGDGITAEEYLLSLIEAGLVSPSEVPKSFREKYLTDSLGTSAAAAISDVILADVVIEDEGGSDNTTHLKSYVGFINYILTEVIPGMGSNPYSMGNEISAIQSEISSASKALGGTAEAPTPYHYTEGDEANTPGATASDYKQFEGMTLKEIAIEGLNLCINPEIGLWGKTSEKNPTGTEFLFTNGFMKAMAIYNDYQATYPYPVAAAKALMTGLMSDEPSTGNICEVYNVWTAIDRLQTNLKATWFNPDDILEVVDGTKPTKNQVLAAIDEEFAKNAPAAVINSYNKILGYKKVDGGFGHSYTAGTATHQGLPVSNGANVSDVDATCIGSTGLTREMFAALGLSKYKIPLFTKSDWMRYISILENAEPALKGTEADALIDFSNAEFPSDIDVKYGSMTLVKHNGSNAIRLDEKAGASLVIERSTVSTVGSAVIFNADVTFAGAGTYVLEFSTDDGFAYTVELTVSDGEILARGASTLGASYNLGEAINIEIQLVPVYSEDGSSKLEARLKLDDISLGSLGLGVYSLGRLTEIKALEIKQQTAGAIVLDNVIFMITDPRAKVDFEGVDISTAGSAKLDLNGMNGIITQQIYSACTAVTVTENANKYLHFEKTVGGSSNDAQTQSYMHFTWNSTASNEIAVETRIRMARSAKSKSGDVKLTLLGANGNVAWQMYIQNSAVVLYQKNTDGSYTTINKGFGELGMASGEWFDFKVIVSTTDDGAFSADTFINDNHVGTVTAPYKNFIAAGNIVDFGITPDRAWLGTIDVDDIDAYSVGGTVSAEDLPLPENPTRYYVCDVHTPTDAVIENSKEATCLAGASHDEVVYCIGCGAELSRVTVVTSEPCDHRMGLDASCVWCEEKIVILGAVDFSNYPEGDWTINSSDSVIVNQIIQTNAVAYTTIITEGEDKFLRMDKDGTTSSTGARQSWLVLQRTAAVAEGEPVVIQMTMRHNPVSGSSSYLRFYKGRTAADGNNGTFFGTSATRNIMFNMSGGYLTFNGTSLGVKANEWFTLRLVLSGTTIDAFVAGADGKMEHKATFIGDSTWATMDLTDCDAMVLMNDSTTFHETDFKYVYFGGMPEYLLEEELAKIADAPDGALTFDEMAEGTLAGGTYGNNAIGYYKQSKAVAEMSVVTDGENKVLSINKSGYDATSNAQTWLNVGIAPGAGDVRVFEAKMKIESWTNKGSGAYFRLYQGRNVASDGGTNISGNINLLGEGGKVSIKDKSTGIAVGEWFTIRIVMSSSGYEILIRTEGAIDFKSHISVTGLDFSVCDVVTHMTTNENVEELRFEYIYFGGEPTYGE